MSNALAAPMPGREAGGGRTCWFMTGIMPDSDRANNGLVLERGGTWGSWKARRGVKRRRLLVPPPLAHRLDCRMHMAALAVRGSAHETPSRQWQAIKETTHRPWSILARRLVEAKQAGCPQEQVEAMALALRDWVCMDLYGEQDSPDPNGRAALMRQAKAA